MPEPNLSMFSPEFASHVRALTERRRDTGRPTLASPEATRLPPEAPGPTRLPPEAPGPTRLPDELKPTRLPPGGAASEK